MDTHLSPAETAKRLGLSLGQIGELLSGADALDSILAVQERVLAEDRERIARALALIRKARSKLASGDILSIDDLAALTQETVMTKQSSAAELKEILTPFKRKYLTPQEEASLAETSVKEWASGVARQSMRELMDEAKALLTSGDATTAAALDFARRFRATTEHLKSSEPSPLTALRPKLKSLMDDARSNPHVAKKLEVFAFVDEALADLKAKEDSSESRG